jgi:hypothetical protein
MEYQKGQSSFMCLAAGKISLPWGRCFFSRGPRSVTGSPMESDLEHAVNERGLKVPTHNVTLYV